MTNRRPISDRIDLSSIESLKADMALSDTTRYEPDRRDCCEHVVIVDPCSGKEFVIPLSLCDGDPSWPPPGDERGIRDPSSDPDVVGALGPSRWLGPWGVAFFTAYLAVCYLFAAVWLGWWPL